MCRPIDDLEQPVPSSSDKRGTAIRESAEQFTNLNLQGKSSIDQATRQALTDPLVFETVPAVHTLRIALTLGILFILRPWQATSQS